MKHQLLLVFALTLVISLPLFASGQDESSMAVTLRYPHWFYKDGGAFEEWLRGVEQGFEAENPTIEIDGYEVGFTEYLEKLETGVAAGDAPDVMCINPAMLGKFAPLDALVALDDLIDMNSVKNNFSPLQTKEVLAAAPDNKTYTLLVWTNIYLPLYRPSVFKNRGISSYATTPEEFVSMTKKLTGDGMYGYAATLNPGNWQEALYELTIWTYGMGGNWSRNGKPNLDSPEVIKAMSSLKTLYDAGVMPKETTKSTYRQMFAAGKVGTIIDGPFLYPMSVNWEASVENDFAATDLPFPTQRVTAIFWGSSIYSGTEHPQQAAKFVEWISNKKNHADLVAMTGVMAARTDIMEDQSWMDNLLGKWPHFQEFLDHINYAVLQMPLDMPPAKIMEVNKIWWKHGERIIFEDADAAKAMQAAQSEAMKLF
jgi:multiple sugar transport system substrate-binding protein